MPAFRMRKRGRRIQAFLHAFRLPGPHERLRSRPHPCSPAGKQLNTRYWRAERLPGWTRRHLRSLGGTIHHPKSRPPAGFFLCFLKCNMVADGSSLSITHIIDYYEKDIIFPFCSRISTAWSWDRKCTVLYGLHNSVVSIVYGNLLLLSAPILLWKLRKRHRLIYDWLYNILLQHVNRCSAVHAEYL